MKVSVIVPVYNVEEYIGKCLESVVNQTLKEIEIIIINDGSPDNSETIIKKYSKKYKNIKYFKRENHGVAETRNFGIKEASGEYIAFLDSDDYVTLDMYEKMYEKAKSGDFDIVVCDLNYVYKDKVKIAYSNIKKDTCEIKEALINIYPAPWNKIYKRSLFNNDLYFKKVYAEDVEFTYHILPYVKSIGVIHEPFNQYVQREGSLSNTTSKKMYDYITNMNGIVEFYKENGFYQKYFKEIEYAYVRYLYATFIKCILGYEYDEYLKAVDEAIMNVKEKFPKYKKNKYFYHSVKGIYLLLFNKKVAKLYYKMRGKK